jgi:hypothetical protein
MIAAGEPNPKLFLQLLADLVKGSFAGKEFEMLATDQKTGKRRAIKFGPKVSKGAVEQAAEAKATESES